MKKKTFAAVVAAAAMICATSCLKENASNLPGSADTKSAKLSLSVMSAPQTKTVNPDFQINSVDIFIYDGDSESSTYGKLELYRKAKSAEITDSGAEVSLNVSTGPKNIYVLVNYNGNIANTAYTETILHSALSVLGDNTTGSLVMAGSAKATLVSDDDNTIAVTCRRLASKISFGSVIGAIESPFYAARTIKLSRIFLLNVTKRVNVFNGDVNDVFGTVAEGTALLSGTEGYPEGFIPATNGAVEVPYYKYALPAANGSSSNGYHNWFDPTEFQEDESYCFDPEEGIEDLLIKDITNGNLYPSGSHTYAVDYDFYVYPNPAVPASDDHTRDNTTKVVAEVLFYMPNGYNGTDVKRYYYPISIPYTQPNYHYNIESLTIKRPGSKDPSLPVTKAECTFNITVTDWLTGNIVGQYNNETGSGTFVF